MRCDVTIRLPARYREALARLAADEGEAAAVVLRQVLKAEAKRRGVWPADRPTADEPDRGAVRC